jgi:ABC-type Fe3+-hydroxamate transport system substrate-binding protein
VTIPAPASRIVCISPGGCECLFAIGAGAAVVADASSCDYPAAATLVPKVDGSDAGTIDEGKVLALKPDLVVTSGPDDRGIDARLLARGLLVFAYSPTDFVGVARSIMALGALAGKAKASIILAESVTEGVRRLRTITDAIPTGRRPRIFWLSSSEPLWTYGRGSLPQAIMDVAGGRNAFIDLAGEGARVSSEDLAERAPQVIVAPTRRGESFALAPSPESASIPAIRDGKVLFVPEALVSRGGPRIVLGLLVVAKYLHPDLFP